MRMFLGIFRSIGGLLSLLALLILALIIWFVLPAFSMGGSNPFSSALSRGGMIATMFAVAFIYKIRTWLINRKRNDQLAKGVVEESGSVQDNSEKKTEFKSKFEEAIRLLKKQKGRGTGSGYLYDLPWYMLIGPPGSGKTTALINSGLHFPLLDKFGASIRGVGGTKDCDWWFTDQAVLIDTAGRFTTQDNQQARDKKDWNTFLSLLLKYRKRKPINGIVVAYSVEDLIRKEESEIISDSLLIKRRIYELYEKLKIEFPVYVVLTKLDLIPGFEEFFGDLDAEGRAQVWGTTFNIAEQHEDPVSRYLLEHKLLTERLQLKVIDRLKNEPDLVKRDQIYLFPRMIASLQDRISVLLDTSFKPTRFEKDLMLRGVYFTSGVQDGTVLDKVISGLSAHMGRVRQSEGRKGKSFFIKDLLNEVVFKEAALAGKNIRFEKIRSNIYLGLYGLIIAVSIGVVSLWYQSYNNNLKQVEAFNLALGKLESQRQEVKDSDYSIKSALPVLNTARDMPFGYEYKNNRQFMRSQFGLNQTIKMHSESMRLYERALVNVLLPRLVFFVEEQLVSPNDNTFEDLQLYLMLGGDIELDKGFLRDYMDKRFNNYQPHNKTAVTEHVLTLMPLLTHYFHPSLNVDLLATAQQSLLLQPVSTRILDQIQSSNYSMNVPGLRLLDLVGNSGALIFSIENKSIQDIVIPGMYTRQGAAQLFSKETDLVRNVIKNDAKILGYDKELIDEYQREFFRHYLQEYQQAWLSVLNSIELSNIAEVPDKIRAIDIIINSPSPVALLLEKVRLNTDFPSLFLTLDLLKERDAIAQESDLTQMESRDAEAAILILIDNRLHSLVTLEMLPIISQINRFTLSEGEDEQQALAGLFTRLETLKVFLQGLGHSINAERSAWMRASNHQGMDDVVTQLEVDIFSLPQPVSTWVAQLLESTKAETGSQARNYIENQWASNVVPACRDMIEGRYPFDANSSREITLRDLASYFASNGIVDDYFENFLSPYVDRSRSPWIWQNITGFESSSVNNILRHVELSNRVQNMFFGPRGDTPSISFELVPREVDPEILKVTLTIDNEMLTYSHGPQLGRRFSWPSSNLTTQSFSRLVIESETDNESITERGDWSLLRLLSHGRMSRLDSERYLIEFRTRNGHRFSFELIAGSVYNPFDVNLFTSIRCR